MSNVTQNRRRLFRFSLRTLLIAWLLLAAWLAWWITGSQQQQNAIRQIRQLADDPGIYYAHQVLPTSDPGATRIIGDESIASWAPDFLIRWLGIDYFHKVESVIVLNSRPGKDVELATQLAQLSNLRHLALVYAGPTDAAVNQLIKLRQLRSLELSHTSLTDASLKAIDGLSTLEALDITGDFTEAGLAELRRLKHLKLLTINSPRLTDAGIAKLGEMYDTEAVRN